MWCRSNEMCASPPQLATRLPARVQGYPWRLAYSTVVHGTSLKTLYRNLLDVDCPVLLIIRDMNNQVNTRTHLNTGLFTSRLWLMLSLFSPADIRSIFHSPVSTEWTLLRDRRDVPLHLLSWDQGLKSMVLLYISSMNYWLCWVNNISHLCVSGVPLERRELIFCEREHRFSSDRRRRVSLMSLCLNVTVVSVQ